MTSEDVDRYLRDLIVDHRVRRLVLLVITDSVALHLQCKSYLSILYPTLSENIYGVNLVIEFDWIAEYSVLSLPDMKTHSCPTVIL